VAVFLSAYVRSLFTRCCPPLLSRAGTTSWALRAALRWPTRYVSCRSYGSSASGARSRQRCEHAVCGSLTYVCGSVRAPRRVCDSVSVVSVIVRTCLCKPVCLRRVQVSRATVLSPTPSPSPLRSLLGPGAWAITQEQRARRGGVSAAAHGVGRRHTNTDDVILSCVWHSTARATSPDDLVQRSLVILTSRSGQVVIV
jgi:hypothetical protein